MASIQKRGKKYCVIYNYRDEDGKKKQKWETWNTLNEANKRKKEIEYKQDIGDFVIPKCTTIEELMDEYVSLYGKEKWALSTFERNVRMIQNYILPKIGNKKLEAINTRFLELFYKELQTSKATENIYNKAKGGGFIKPSVIRDIHKLLRSCFKQAVKWELMEKNPCVNATRPRVERAEREIWTMEDLQRALDVCEDDRLKLAINLAFSCTLRLGEMMALTWDCVDISEASVNAGKPSIQINKEMQRVDRKTLKILENKDVIREFPSTKDRTKTILVLKTPKTKSSVRKIYLPVSVAKMLIDWRERQDTEKEALGSEYTDYNLVFTGPFGGPVEGGTISDGLQKLIQDHDLPKGVFHSLRHSSITYKLKLNGGDIKAVQGDSGHAQATMVTEQYSHVLTDGQQANAELIEKYFYGKEPIPERQGTENTSSAGNSGESMELLTKLLANPETAALLKALAEKL